MRSTKKTGVNKIDVVLTKSVRVGDFTIPAGSKVVLEHVGVMYEVDEQSRIHIPHLPVNCVELMEVREVPE